MKNKEDRRIIWVMSQKIENLINTAADAWNYENVEQHCIKFCYTECRQNLKIVIENSKKFIKSLGNSCL